MNIELKPVRCGCGGEAKIGKNEWHYDTGTIEEYYVYCKECLTATGAYDTETEAIEAWNRAMGIAEKSSVVERTAKVEEVEKPNVFKCSECGQYFHSTAWGSPVEYCSRCGARLEWE